MRVFESEIRNKSVMSDEGTYLGIVRNITVDPKTGDLHHLLVEAAETVDPRIYERDSNGYLMFPFTAVRSVHDAVILGMA